MGDTEKRDDFGKAYRNNGVNRDDFLRLMRELGLNPDKKEEKAKLEPGVNPDDPFGKEGYDKPHHHHHHHHKH